MTRTARPVTCLAFLTALALPAVAAAQPAVLTADRAVQLALQYNSQIISANAGVYSARAGTYRAFSGVLPQVSASITRSGTWTKNKPGTLAFGAFSSVSPDKQEQYSTSPTVGGTWNVLNLSSLTNLSSARAGLQGARFSLDAARSDVALAARQQFYLVVQAAKLIDVQTNALQVARDSERRVRALFDVGSVSRNDVLQAQVQTAQSELDSIAAVQALLVQRNALASLIGTEESKMGPVDTVLTFTPRAYDEAQLLSEAETRRPDLKAASAALRSARAAVWSARLLRVPYLTIEGNYTYQPVSSSKNTFTAIKDSLGNVLKVPEYVISSRSEADRQTSARVALNWDIFDGLATEATNAQARANLLTAQDTYDVLRRNLAGQVHQVVLTYQQDMASESVADAAVANAAENLKLIRQKYNVGSATILDLITAQVALQRAQSQLVNALAQIRVAEAQIDQVRGVVP